MSAQTVTKGSDADASHAGGPLVVMLADVDLGEADGARAHVVEIAAGFARAGRTVELVARGSNPRIPGVRFHSAEADGGRARRILAMNRTALEVLRGRRRQTRALYWRYDSGLVGVVVLARLAGYRPVAEMNNVLFGSDYPFRDRGPQGWVVDRGKVAALLVAGRVNRHVVAVTDGIGRLLVERYRAPRARVHTIGNGVDLARFRVWDRGEALRRTGLDPACRHVVYVGALASWVDFPVLLGSFALVARTRPDARLVIVGDGPEAAQMDALVAEHGLHERVIRPGLVADRDLVGAYMGAANVCVIAYHGTALERIGVSPMKLAEYLAAGRAVVGTRLAGIDEVIRESGAGIVVPSDATSMAAAIGELLDDPERADALGRAGRRAAEERYSWTSVVQRTLDLLDDAA